MSENINSKQYDLEARTLSFAKAVRAHIKKLHKTVSNIEDTKQVVRSSGSVGANYIEANESLGKKDFIMRIKICRKEAKETCYWLKLIELNNDKYLTEENSGLIDEAQQLMKIFGSILEKSK